MNCFLPFFIALLLIPVDLASPIDSSQSEEENRLHQRQDDTGSPTQHSDLVNAEQLAAIVYNVPNSTSQFDPVYVDAQLEAPFIWGPEGSGVTLFVAIDGSSCPKIWLQNGFSATMKNGEISYSAWYQWGHDTVNVVHDFDIQPGDIISASAYATTPTNGGVSLKNWRTGDYLDKNLSSSSSLCGQDAMWAIADYVLGGSSPQLADFNPIQFTGIYAIVDRRLYIPSEGLEHHFNESSSGPDSERVIQSALVNGDTITFTHV